MNRSEPPPTPRKSGRATAIVLLVIAAIILLLLVALNAWQRPESGQQTSNNVAGDYQGHSSY